MRPLMQLAVLLALNAALGLWGSASLGFDLDEMATAAWVLSRDFGDLFAQIGAAHEGNAIGYPVFIYLWGKLGQGALWLRLPSVLAATATVALFYRRYARAHSMAAFLSALLLSLSTLWLTHAQNARCFALFAFFSFAAFLLHEKMEEEPGRTRWNLLFTLSALASLSLHHFAVLYLAPLFAKSACRILQKRAPVSHLAAPLATFLFYLPQSSFLLHQWRFGPQWIPVVTAERLAGFVRNFLSVQHALPTLLAAALILFGALRRFRAQRKLLTWTLFPFLACLAISLGARSLLVERYLLPSLMGAFAFAGFGLQELFALTSKSAGAPRILHPSALKTLLVAIPLSAATLALFQLPNFFAHTKDADFRGAAAFVREHEPRCGSKVVTDLRLLRRWPYYLPHAHLSGWGTQLPPRPYWLVQAGYEVPAYVGSMLEGAKLHWRGNNAVAACVE